MGYWRKVWRNAVRRYLDRLKAGRGRLMGWVIQTTIVFGILYFQPWVGDLQDEAKLAAAGVAAVIVSALLSFVWDLFASPEELHKKVETELEQHVQALCYYADQARHAEAMIALYREGEAIYSGEDNYRKWRDGMIAWNERVRAALKEHYYPNVLFKHDTAKGRGVRSKWVEIVDEDQPRRGEYNELFTGWLESFEKIIQGSYPVSFMDYAALKRLHPGAETPDDLIAPRGRVPE